MIGIVQSVCSISAIVFFGYRRALFRQLVFSAVTGTS